MSSLPARDPHRYGRRRIAPGECAELYLSGPAGAQGLPARLPLAVWRAPFEGPTVCITAAVHGDELNGTGALRQLLAERPFELSRGTLILAPLVNGAAFERQSRYSSDGRDLNRCFPGKALGSPSSRLARLVQRELIARADFVLDLHTAPRHRTNFPHLRVDGQDSRSLAIARAFGAPLILNSPGNSDSLRSAAVAAGRPCVVVEAGAASRIEPAMVAWILGGLQRLLVHLGLVEGPCSPASEAVLLSPARWIRAQQGGLLRLHVSPGSWVAAGQPLATTTNVFGRPLARVDAPAAGVIVGLTTLPAAGTGDALLHLAETDPQSLPPAWFESPSYRELLEAQRVGLEIRAQ